LRPSSNIAPPGDGSPTPTGARSDLLAYMVQHLVYTKLLSRYCINLEPTLNPNSGRFGHGTELRLRHCLEREQRLGGGLGIAPAPRSGTVHHTSGGGRSRYGELQSRTPRLLHYPYRQRQLKYFRKSAYSTCGDRTYCAVRARARFRIRRQCPL